MYTFTCCIILGKHFAYIFPFLSSINPKHHRFLVEICFHGWQKYCHFTSVSRWLMWVWVADLFLRCRPLSDMWVGLLIFFDCHQQGLLNDHIFSNLRLWPTQRAVFMCHHQCSHHQCEKHLIFFSISLGFVGRKTQPEKYYAHLLDKSKILPLRFGFQLVCATFIVFPCLFLVDVIVVCGFI